MTQGGATLAEAATLATAIETPPPSGSLSSTGQASQPADFGPRYEVIGLLGEGGMGAVYRAYDRDLDRMVALKLIRPALAADATVTQRFRQELLLASKISHKNVLRIHDLGEAKGTRFISMAYIEGEDLHKLLQREGRLPLSRAVGIAKQLCSALEAAHAEGVVHRDLKPQNILLDKAGQVYVSDFGLAKSLESDATQMTMSGQFLGTPRYMSPEQALAGAVDHRSDLYSFGLILYEMLTGEIPFKAESTLQTMYLRAHEKPSSPKLLNPELPDYMVRIIMHCLETSPADRYQSAKEVLADLEMMHAPASAPKVRIPLPAVSLSLPRKQWAVVAACVFMAAVMIVAVPQWRASVFHLLRPNLAANVPHSELKYVAVVPFQVLGDNTLQYVAQGIADALSAKLFQVRDVRLAPADAVQDAHTQAALQKLARQTGVNLIVDGTVQRGGDKIRIIANLTDAQSGRRIWTQDFSGLPQDILTLEDQIYARLVTAMEIHLSNRELAASSSHPTEDFSAYQAYLRGKNAMRGQQDPKNVRAAIGFYNQALKRDPRFALAYAGMADADLQLYVLEHNSEWAAKAVGAAQQAASLDETLSEAHFALGSVYKLTGKTAEAVAELEEAVKLAPNSDDGYRRLGEAYLNAGKTDKGIQCYQKAVQINPYYWINYNALGEACFRIGSYDKALQAFGQVIKLEPENPDGYGNTGAIYVQQGKWKQAIQPLQEALRLQPSAISYSNLGTAYFYLKSYPEAVQAFEKAVAMSPSDETSMGNLADGYRWSGQSAKARATYDRAITLAYRELQVNPRNAVLLGTMALYYAKKGDSAQAAKFIQRARSIDRSDVGLLYDEAVVSTLSGDYPGAVRSLEAAVRAGYAPELLASDPEFDVVRNRPEFTALVRQPPSVVRKK